MSHKYGSFEAKAALLADKPSKKKPHVVRIKRKKKKASIPLTADADDNSGNATPTESPGNGGSDHEAERSDSDQLDKCGHKIYKRPKAPLRKLHWLAKSLWTSESMLRVGLAHMLVCGLLAWQTASYVEFANDASAVWALEELKALEAPNCGDPSIPTCAPMLTQIIEEDVMEDAIWPPVVGLTMEMGVFRIGSNAVTVSVHLYNHSDIRCTSEPNELSNSSADLWLAVLWNVEKPPIPNSSQTEGTGMETYMNSYATLFNLANDTVMEYRVGDGGSGPGGATLLGSNVCWRCIGTEATFSLPRENFNFSFSKDMENLPLLWGVGTSTEILDNPSALSFADVQLTQECDDVNSRLAALETSQSIEEMTQIMIYEDVLFRNPLALVRSLVAAFEDHFESAYCRLVPDRRAPFFSVLQRDVAAIAASVRLEDSNFADLALDNEGVSLETVSTNADTSSKRSNVAVVLKISDKLRPPVPSGQSSGGDHGLELDILDYYYGQAVWFLVLQALFTLGAVAFVGTVLQTRMNTLEPMDAVELLHTFFRGMNAGTFMVSYRWADRLEASDPEGLWPRRLASWLPSCWLDIEQLLPGTPLKPSIRRAARESRFRFVFVSQGYWSSPNCLVEWEQIDAEPGRCIIFAYDDVPEDRLQTLKERGHNVWRLTAVLADTKDPFGPLWLLEKMLCENLGLFLFNQTTPPINEGWLATLRFWLQGFDYLFVFLSLPSLALGVGMIVVLGVFLWKAFLFDIMTRQALLVILSLLGLVLPIVVICLAFYTAWFLYGTGLELPAAAPSTVDVGHMSSEDAEKREGSNKATDARKKRLRPRDLPDACLLLLFLDRLQVFPDCRFFSTTPTQAGVILRRLLLIADTPMAQADVRVIKADALTEEQTAALSPTTYDSFWSSGGFLGLSEAVREALGDFIIEQGGKSSLTLEFICCKMLLKHFDCPTVEALDKGRGEYSQISLERAD